MEKLFFTRSLNVFKYQLMKRCQMLSLSEKSINVLISIGLRNAGQRYPLHLHLHSSSLSLAFITIIDTLYF